jgi:type IV secretory pathway VirB10-like protein
MARLRLPRFPLLGRRDDNPERDEHEKLVLIAEVAGFVVVTSIIATFVLMVANSSGGQAATPNPEVPSITDAGGPAADVEPAPPVAKPPKVIPPPAVGERAEAVKPKPKPKPTTPSSTPTSPPQQPEVVFADPYDRCAPDGARAFTPRFHYPLECRDGRWRFDGDDGDDDDPGNGNGNGHGRGN